MTVNWKTFDNFRKEVDRDCMWRSNHDYIRVKEIRHDLFIIEGSDNEYPEEAKRKAMNRIEDNLKRINIGDRFSINSFFGWETGNDGFTDLANGMKEIFALRDEAERMIPDWYKDVTKLPLKRDPLIDMVNAYESEE